MITVLVVDDHDLLREGVSSCLSAFDDLEVVGESASGEEGLEAASRLRPDVVVIDLIMPGSLSSLGCIRNFTVPGNCSRSSLRIIAAPSAIVLCES